MKYACPCCGSVDLRVVIEVWADLCQSPDNFETEINDGDHAWDHDSTMQCKTCGDTESAFRFQLEED